MDKYEYIQKMGIKNGLDGHIVGGYPFCRGNPINVFLFFEGIVEEKQYVSKILT
jgi:hypothetical protein